MPKFGAAVDFQKIPSLRFVPESTGTPPSSPVLGQLYTDTGTEKNYWWNGTAWFSFDDVVDSAVTNAKVSASAAIARSKLDFGSGLVNADLASGAAIAYSKLALTGAILNADLAGSIAYGKLSLTGAILNADLAGSIAYGKLSLTGAIVNADLAGSIDLNKLATDPLARANHTGSQAASTISDLASVVKAYRLDEFDDPNTSVAMGSQKITGLADGTTSNDAVNLGQLQAAAAGIDMKASVRAASTANVTIASELEDGDEIDGVTLATGDRVLLKDQSTGSQNGIYVVVASGAASRSADALNPNSFVFVEEGTAAADTAWMISTNGPISVGSTDLVWSQFAGSGGTYTADGSGIEVAGNQFSLELASNSGLSKSSSGLTVASGIAGTGLTLTSGVLDVVGGTGITANANDIAVDTAVVARKYTVTTTGAGWTGGAAKTITHNLGNRWVTCQLYITSTGEQVLADVITVDSNSLTVTVAVSQSDGYYYVVVVG
jgi:hypothetical protein